MKRVEFYFLLDNHTWTTDFVDIPEELLNGTPSENEASAIKYVYDSLTVLDKVDIVGIYNWGDE